MSDLSDQEEPSASSRKTKGGGSIYWVFHHTFTAIGSWVWRHKIWATVLFIVVILLLATVGRTYFHNVAIWIRIEIAPLLMFAVVLFFWWFFTRKRRKIVKFAFMVPILALAYATFFWSGGIHQYLRLYAQYQALNVQVLKKMPLTDNERIQPHNVILSVAQEKIADDKSAMDPDFVRGANGSYRWVLAVEPAFAFKRIFGEVTEVFNLSGTSAAPDWRQRIKVRFDVGENMLWSKNIRTCIIRSFGPWRYWNYEPSDLRYMRDDDGEIVQVVSLIRWEGFLFPRPTFGGVHVIRQIKEKDGWFFNTVTRPLRRIFLGCGKFIPAEDIKKYAFLRGQNLMPYSVSRFIASSFRFQNGFFAPMPWNHAGDIRIPDLPGDVNQQPFTTFFLDKALRVEGKLYHYFALEPYHKERFGLSLSLLVPADGIGKTFVVRHGSRSSLSGVSTIAAKIRESKPNFDWKRARPVEFRPFVRDIAGERRLFWLGTVVSLKRSGGAIAGGAPRVTLTDALHNVVAWVNASNPDGWVRELLGDKNLQRVWKHE